MAEDKPTATERAGSVKDARGRLVSQLDPVRLHVWHRYDVIEAEALHQIVEALEPGTAKMRRRMILIVPAAVVLLVIFVATFYYVSDAGTRRDLVSTLLNPAIGVPSILCCIVVPWMTARQARLRRIRFAMLKHRRCPHCGYNLHGLPTAPEDGTIVCPECGCAWLIDDAALAEGLAAAAPGTPATAAQRKAVLIMTLLLTVTALAGCVFFLMMR